ncbi:MAG: carbonic anhydrase [Bacteroidetes bacterium]|nr:carbonic anhydrase [Bacteroidota bacterium]
MRPTFPYCFLLFLLPFSSLFAQEPHPIAPSEIHTRLGSQISKAVETMNQEKKRSGHESTPKDITVFVTDKPVAPAAHAEQEDDRSIVSNLNRLSEGNKRFVSGTPKRKEVAAQRRETVNGQHPYAIVITCSDSRVPPEMIFDESVGQLFVIRLAGNVVDSLALGSVEYAVEHLHAHTLLVLGHESCGAVKAAAEGGHLPPNIAAITRRIEPAVAAAKARSITGPALINECVKENVHEQIRRTMKNSSILFDAMVKGELLVLGGIYDLASGKVRFLTGN